MLAKSFETKEKQEGKKGYTFKYANHTYNLYRAKIYPNVKLEFYNNQQKTLKELGYSGEWFTIDLAIVIEEKLK